MSPAPKRCAFAVMAGLASENGQAFKDVGDLRIRLKFGGTCERVVGVAFAFDPNSAQLRAIHYAA